MAVPPGRPTGAPLNMRGAVDLSGMKGAPTTPGSPASDGGGFTSVVIDATDANFEQVVMQSMTVPVIVDLWAEWCAPCRQLGPVLEKVAQEYDGAWLLAKVDVEANPGLSQAFQAQSIPLVVAIVKGQPVPLFKGAVPESHVRDMVQQMLALAKQHGVTGRLALEGLPSTDEDAPLPPLHQKAIDAITAGDLTTAAQAYRQAITEHPSDSDAKAGLAQVELMDRTAKADLAQARTNAAANPNDLEAQLAVADADMLGGHVDDALARLLDAVRAHQGADREKARQRMLSYFDMLGSDERVTKARRMLASALF